MSGRGSSDDGWRIGFDVAQTCVERAGCGWYADSLAHALANVLSPADTLLLYHHFGGWINPDVSRGTHLPGLPNVREPLRDLAPGEAAAVWGVRPGGDESGTAADMARLGRPDLVHANCFQAPCVPGARLVFTIYDLSFWEVPGFTTERNRLVCQAGVLAAMRRTAGLVFISDSTCWEFEEIFPGWLERSRVPWTVVPLAPRPRSHSVAVGPPADESRPSSDDTLAPWLAVGSLEPRKNHATLLDALELYWDRSVRPRPLLLVGGDGWRSEGLLARVATMEATGRVRRLGYVSEERLERLYGQSYALLFPSWHEGFGLPVLEAMASGCPVVCSDRASLWETAGDAAHYVNPASAESLCKAMLALDASPARRAALAAAGRARAARFSWERTARETLAFYRRVLATETAKKG